MPISGPASIALPASSRAAATGGGVSQQDFDLALKNFTSRIDGNKIPDGWRDSEFGRSFHKSLTSVYGHNNVPFYPDIIMGRHQTIQQLALSALIKAQHPDSGVKVSFFGPGASYANYQEYGAALYDGNIDPLNTFKLSDGINKAFSRGDAAGVLDRLAILMAVTPPDKRTSTHINLEYQLLQHGLDPRSTEQVVGAWNALLAEDPLRMATTSALDLAQKTGARGNEKNARSKRRTAAVLAQAERV